MRLRSWKVTKDNQPPEDAPEATVWGGVDGVSVSLRVSGEGLDPAAVTAMLACEPTHVGLTPSRGRQWLFGMDELDDLEDGVRMLLNAMTSDLSIWRELNATYRVDIFCGLFLEDCNRGFSVSPALSQMLAERGLSIGFDIYCP